MTMFNDVKQFHDKFGINQPDKIALLSPALQEFRERFLQEELDEFILAHKTGDLNTAADSLIDLVYVCLGTAQMMGIDESTWNKMWQDVQTANMSKERAKSKDDSRSVRQSEWDIVKPAGFVAPDHTNTINQYNKK